MTSIGSVGSLNSVPDDSEQGGDASIHKNPPSTASDSDPLATQDGVSKFDPNRQLSPDAKAAMNNRAFRSVKIKLSPDEPHFNLLEAGPHELASKGPR